MQNEANSRTAKMEHKMVLDNTCPTGAAGIGSSSRWPLVRGQKRLVNDGGSRAEGAGDPQKAQNEANFK